MAISCPSSSGPQMRASKKLLRAYRALGIRACDSPRARRTTMRAQRRKLGKPRGETHQHRAVGIGGRAEHAPPIFGRTGRAVYAYRINTCPPDLLTAVQQFCIRTFLLQLTKYYILYNFLSVSSSIELHGLRA